MATFVALAGLGLGALGLGVVTRRQPAVPAPRAVLGQTGPLTFPGTASSYYGPEAAGTTELAAPGHLIAGGRDAPDPFVLVQGGRYYLYTSEGDRAHTNVPVQDGAVLGRWGPLLDAMPALPRWAVPGFTWAPDVHRFGDHDVLYFTSVVAGSSPADECIGAAQGPTPLGPFRAGAQPFICQLDQHGSIDPRTFTDVDGRNYMIWKSDDNADVNGTEPTSIYSEPLSADGLHLLGRPTRIFGPDRPWQGRIVEAPDLFSVDGGYWLFYSGGWFNQTGYAIGAARCAGPLGPCADTATGPLLTTNFQGAGPGEPSVFTDLRGVWLAYTPWRSDTPRHTPPRPVMLTRLGFGPLGPYLASWGAAVGGAG